MSLSQILSLYEHRLTYTVEYGNMTGTRMERLKNIIIVILLTAALFLGLTLFSIKTEEVLQPVGGTWTRGALGLDGEASNLHNEDARYFWAEETLPQGNLLARSGLESRSTSTRYRARIPVEQALAQVNRITEARHLSEEDVRRLVTLYTEGTLFGLLEPHVNVLDLNAALDELD